MTASTFKFKQLGRSRSRRAFTLAELMISMVLLLFLISSVRSAFFVILRRSVVDRAVYNVEVEQESAATIITGLLKVATRVELYTDGDAFSENGPQAIQRYGNFAVLYDQAGNILACLEYRVGFQGLFIYRGDTPDNINGLELNYGAVPISITSQPDYIFRLTDGLFQANWTVYGRFEKLDVHCLGVPLRMR